MRLSSPHPWYSLADWNQSHRVGNIKQANATLHQSTVSQQKTSHFLKDCQKKYERACLSISNSMGATFWPNVVHHQGELRSGVAGQSVVWRSQERPRRAGYHLEFRIPKPKPAFPLKHAGVMYLLGSECMLQVFGTFTRLSFISRVR